MARLPLMSWFNVPISQSHWQSYIWFSDIHTALISHFCTPQQPFHKVVQSNLWWYCTKGVHKATLAYIGPLSAKDTQWIVGHFQSSPLSLISKPGQPGKYHIIQDLSHPRGSPPMLSINMRMSADEFTTSYSTFPIVSLLLSFLSPESQGAVQDVAKAYCTIPIHALQWRGLVVCLSKSQFAIDTALCFGFTPLASIYGNIASAGADIMHFIGIGPILW